MFSLSQSPKLVLKNKKRVGRGEGSNHGKNAGYGHKGQTKRSGKVPIFFAGGASDAGTSILSRNPKLKGFKARENKQTISLGLAVILKKVDSTKEITLELLKNAGLVDNKVKLVRVIMSNNITEKVKIKFDTNSNIHLTKGVKEAIA